MLQKMNQTNLKIALENLEISNHEWFSGDTCEFDVYYKAKNNFILTMIYPNEKIFTFKNVEDLRAFVYSKEYLRKDNGNY